MSNVRKLGPYWFVGSGADCAKTFLADNTKSASCDFSESEEKRVHMMSVNEDGDLVPTSRVMRIDIDANGTPIATTKSGSRYELVEPFEDTIRIPIGECTVSFYRTTIEKMPCGFVSVVTDREHCELQKEIYEKILRGEEGAEIAFKPSSFALYFQSAYYNYGSLALPPWLPIKNSDVFDHFTIPYCIHGVTAIRRAEDNKIEFYFGENLILESKRDDYDFDTICGCASFDI